MADSQGGWYGYQHTNGGFHLKRYFCEEDLDEVRRSDFVFEVFGPWPGVSKSEATSFLTVEIDKYHAKT